MTTTTNEPTQPDHEPAPIAPNPSTADIMAMEAAHQALTATLRPATKAALFAVLAKAGIATVIVQFDGAGDSGQIESVDAVDANGAPRPLPSTMVTMSRAVWGDNQPQLRTLPAAEAIETFAYDLLGEVHGGWEINDGAYGSLKFDVGTGEVRLECNVRFTDAEQHLHTF